MRVINKRVILSLPLELYEGVRRVAHREYQSVTGVIRETLLKRIREEFTPEEMALIEKGRKSFVIA